MLQYRNNTAISDPSQPSPKVIYNKGSTSNYINKTSNYTNFTNYTNYTNYINYTNTSNYINNTGN